MSDTIFQIGDRVRRQPEPDDQIADLGQIGEVMESDGSRGTTWRVLIDWGDGEPPAFLDTSRIRRVD